MLTQRNAGPRGPAAKLMGTLDSLPLRQETLREPYSASVCQKWDMDRKGEGEVASPHHRVRCELPVPAWPVLLCHWGGMEVGAKMVP